MESNDVGRFVGGEIHPRFLTLMGSLHHVSAYLDDFSDWFVFLYEFYKSIKDEQ